MQKVVQVIIKNVYGKEMVYPANEQAFWFAKIANQKTLSSDTIRAIKELGYEIVIQPQTLSL